MKKMVVTGASSYIAKTLVCRLLDEGNMVFAVVRNPQKLADLSSYENLKIVECDMNNYNVLPNLIDDKCDDFFHFAWAGTSKAERMDKRIQESNIKNSLVAIFAARELGCECFIGAGSQAEYGICIDEITEEHSEDPVTEYGRTKLAVKRMGLEYGRIVGMRFIWTRIFSAYGMGDSPQSMIISSIKKMLINEPIDLTDCTQSWDYINVYDVARAYEYLITKGSSGVYNIASGDRRPLMDFVLDMKKAVMSESELRFGAVQTSLTGQGFKPDVSKLKGLGWKPSYSFFDGVTEIATDMRRRFDQ